MSQQVRPFKIDVPESALDALRDKLAAASFPPEVDFSDDWSYGVPLREVKRLAEHWKDDFDWRKQEAKLNAVPQFKTDIRVEGFGEIGIHFVHQKSSRPGSIPLLFCHGWPGSFHEIVKALPLLTDPKEGPSFHVVAPSLPNFGFSDAVRAPGFATVQYAECLHKLMLRLGYDQYTTQGGDFGSLITRMIGALYPDHCLASHVNAMFHQPGLARMLWLVLRYAVGWYSASEKAGLSRAFTFLRKGAAYMLLQNTKPATLGFALADSPVGLLAWIYEKLHDWTDEYPWTDDEILTWISIYQFSTAGPAANLRIYREISSSEDKRTLKAVSFIPRVSLGISYFPKDVLPPPSINGAQSGPLVFKAEHTEGGHFPSFECPELFAGDLCRMFGPEGGASQVAKTFEWKP